MASIRKKGNSYYVRFYDPTTGKQKEVPAGKKKGDANRLRIEIEGRIANSTYVSLPDISFKKYAEDHFLKNHARHVRESTLKQYKSHLTYRIIPYFESYMLKAVKKGDIESFLNHLADKTVSPNTSKKYLTTLKLVLKTAIADGYLVKNPAEHVRSPRIVKAEMNVLSPSEIELLIDNTDERHKTLVMLACYTGLRQSEAIYLRWEDIEFTSSRLFVRKTELYEPKTQTSLRAIPIPHELLEALKTHQLKQSVELDKNPYNLVFTNREGNPINPSNLDNRVLKPALRRSGLRSVRWHDLRHSYASALLAAGEPIKFVSSLLGHADASITLKVYSHVLPETEVNAHIRIQNVFKTTKPVVQFLKS